MNATINVYRNGIGLFEAPVTSAAKRSRTLMGDNYVSLSFSARREHAPVFEIGDYIAIEGEKYYINERTTPTYNETTGGYDYNLKFVAEERTWANTKMKSLRTLSGGGYAFGETKWASTATLLEHAKTIVRVLRLQAGLDISSRDGMRSVDELVWIDTDYFTDGRHNDHRLMSYDGTDVLSALDALCGSDKYDCEWWVDRVQDGLRINFGRLGRDGSPSLTIENGVDATISREPSQTKYANRLYVYGGTQNVPYSYRKELVFTNTRQDGYLSDDRRVLEPEMIAGAERFPQYVYMDRYQSSRSVYDQYAVKERVYIVARDRGDYYGPVTIDAGEYCVHLSKIHYKAEMITDSLPAFDIFSGSFLTICVQLDGGEIERTPIASGAQGNFLKATLGDDLYINTHHEEELLVWLEADLRFVGVKTILETFCDSAWQEGPQDAVMERLDIFRAQVTIRDVEEDETYSGTWTRTAYDEHIELSEVTQTLHYEIQDVIPAMTPSSYFASDAGEDVINGLSELRLLLPERVAQGYVSRRGYIQPVGLSGPVVEDIVTHDEIYPVILSMPVEDVDGSRKATASLVMPDSSVAERKYSVYYIKARVTGSDGTKYNFKRNYILDGEKLRVKFTTGKLSGLTFEAMFEEDEREQYYLICPNTDYGALLPNDTLRPEIGDEILLLGWNPNAMPELGMIGEAENRLFLAAIDDLEKAYKGDSSYKATMYSATERESESELVDAGGNTLVDSSGSTLVCMAREDVNLLELGDAVTLRDHAIFGTASDGSPNESKPLRVIGYEMKLDYPYDSPQYTIGEIPKPSRLRTLEKKTK